MSAPTITKTQVSGAKKILAISVLGMFCHPALAQVIYSNGFETDTAGWTSATRVPSGTGGVPSSAGAFHATTATGFTTWGGYNYGAGNAVPTVFKEYTTSVDVYMNVGAGLANNTRFDFSSAINSSAGTHLKDFIFNAGFYNAADVTGPGAGTDRFVVSASNNSQPGSAFAKNPANGPIAISTTGWYTLEHHFYNNAGVLAVGMSITDASDNLVNMWTLSDPANLIGGVGGNRYGWVDFNQLPSLAIDNSELRLNTASVPDTSATVVMLALGLAGLVGLRRRFSHN